MSKALRLTQRMRQFVTLRVVLGVLAGVLIGVAIGYSAGTSQPSADPRYALATKADFEKAISDITVKYEAASSTECKDETDPVKPQDRVAVFKNYLKVNKYANRAVIRGCNDIDHLLVKDTEGKWVLSNVNVSLDLRANPTWQVECLIDDITKADDMVRPENSSIDLFNLMECARLQQVDLLAQTIQKGGWSKGPKADRKEIDTLLKAGPENFAGD